MQVQDKQAFHFMNMDYEEVRKVLYKINVKQKPRGYDDVPPKIVRICNDELCGVFTRCIINDCFSSNVFPQDMKKAEISPLFKKNSDIDKYNYRPASISTTVDLK